MAREDSRTTAQHARQARRFIVVGGLAFLIDLAVLSAATRVAGIDPFTARFVSYIAAATIAWLLHRAYTFSGSNRDVSRFRQWLTFLVVNTVGLGVNATVYVGLLLLFPTLAPEFCLAVASAVALAVNYFANAKITFRD